MTTTHSESIAPPLEHFFRHEAAPLVAVLTRIFGWQQFESSQSKGN
jgi:hypothetical protein